MKLCKHEVRVDASSMYTNMEAVARMKNHMASQIGAQLLEKGIIDISETLEHKNPPSILYKAEVITTTRDNIMDIIKLLHVIEDHLPKSKKHLASDVFDLINPK